MHHPLLLQIMENIYAHDNYFVLKKNACPVVGLNSIWTCKRTLCMLAYDQVANACDDYNKIGKATTFTYFKYFVRPMKEVCELEFLKQHI